MTPDASGRPVHRDGAETIYFLSDVHLGGSPPRAERTKRERLHVFFDRVLAEDASLYILGDLFDFWFTYGHAVPRAGFAPLARVQEMARRGTPVHYLGGNHDFWMEDFLRAETGVRVLEDLTVLEAQGRRALLAHGDGLGPGDTGYKVLKRVLRNRFAIGAFRWIHPDLGIRLALWSSETSRHYTGDHPVDVDRLHETVGRPALTSGADAFLMGHHHVPVHRRDDDGDFLILGDWFRRYTCARLRAGTFELLEWPLAEALPVDMYA